MSEDSPPAEATRRQGWTRACEGILRFEFGRRTSTALARAIASLDEDERGLRSIRPAIATTAPGDRREMFREKRGVFPAKRRADRSRSLRPKFLTMLAFAAALAMLATIAAALFGRTMGQPLLEVASGSKVIVERNGETFEPTRALMLQPGDLTRVVGSNAVTISYAPENTRFELHPGTALMVRDWTRGKQFDLREGRLDARVARQRPFQPMVVRTPKAEARVLGTQFTLTVSANATRLDVAQGRVALTRTNPPAGVKVSAGHYAIAADGIELNALPQTGRLLREIWTGIPADSLNDLLYHADYPDRPTARDFVNAFESSEIQTNNFGCRLIGYVHPPVTGEYTFWIAAAAAGILWLSPDENPAGKVRIALAPGGEPHDWDAQPRGGDVGMPKSEPIPLETGRRYFIQAVQRTAQGSSHLSVAWQRPGAERELISGAFLSPYKTKE